MPDTTVVERLAVELHRQYRAAEKAMNGSERLKAEAYGITGLRHDHGWQPCHRKPYFLQRAETIIRRSRIENPETLGEAEQALDATVLMRRLAVDPVTEVGISYTTTGGKQHYEKHASGTVDFDLSEGGEVPAGIPYLVGEHATDAADLFPTRFWERGTMQLKQADIDFICSAFQVPVQLVIGSTGDARRKAVRDTEIRKALWGKNLRKFKYVHESTLAAVRVEITD